MAAPHMPVITAEEYLALEREAEFKSEFYNGQIVAMAGARKSHIRIVANLMRHLGNALAGTPCEPMSNDLRVAADPRCKYFYPDVVVACENAKYLDNNFDTMLNPVVVIEVLSGSTESIDRTIKLDAYLQIDSVKDYVLVDSKSKTVEHYRREGNAWLYTAMRDPADALTFSAVDISLAIDVLYERVVFTDD